MKGRLALEGPDWTFGTVLCLNQSSSTHQYLYMFVRRKPRWFVDGEPCDRGFVAINLGVPTCAGCSGMDHPPIGSLASSLGGLPHEEAWEEIA